MQHIAVKHLAIALTLICATLSAALPARADEAPDESRHQLMKDCMAKQKAAESGKPHADMRKTCRDVTKTEKQNENAEKKAEETPTRP